MPNRHELERLIAGIDEEIRDARRDIKEAETSGDVDMVRVAQQDIAALEDQLQQAHDSLNNLGRAMSER